MGATGTGKSFLAQGLAVAACRHKLTARSFRLSDLADEFDATADAAYERKALLEELTKPAVLVIDDFLATVLLSCHSPGETITFIKPVSSSKPKKMTPAAVCGRFQTVHGCGLRAS